MSPILHRSRTISEIVVILAGEKQRRSELTLECVCVRRIAILLCGVTQKELAGGQWRAGVV